MTTRMTTPWLPIDTAPKDGRLILVCGDKSYTHACVSWDGSLAETNAPSCWAFANRFGYDAYENPTHWMALPECPKQ